uniref:Complex 1 LYR protein domain-containing protein n=1 Tax=Hyaloperonospora arabidopsidis (strain Emoy2) TaxID=559515 RepID=M4B8H3_HYAAE
MTVTKLKLKRPVLQLYAQCLRSARRCPQWEQREMMKMYVRMKLRSEIDTQDPDRVRTLLVDGREELERMNYYHSIYEAKQRLAATAARASSDGTDSSMQERTRPFSCVHCRAAYPSKEANFCASCGTKRPGSS